MMFSHIDLIRSRRTHVSLVGRSSPKAAIGQFPLGSSPWLRGERGGRWKGPNCANPNVHQKVQWFQMFHGCCGFVDYEKAVLDDLYLRFSSCSAGQNWSIGLSNSHEPLWVVMILYYHSEVMFVGFGWDVFWVIPMTLLLLHMYVCIYLYIYTLYILFVFIYWFVDI